MSFIRILTNEQETFDWVYTDPDTGKKFPDTKFKLRMLQPSETRRLQRDHTTYRRRRGGGREEVFDDRGYVDDALDLCIVSWEGVQGSERDKDGNFVDKVLPCERKYKLMLPEPLKIEIGRVCFNRDADALFDDDDDGDADPQKPGKGSH